MRFYALDGIKDTPKWCFAFRLLGLSFVFANKMGILVAPDGQHAYRHLSLFIIDQASDASIGIHLSTPIKIFIVEDGIRLFFTPPLFFTE